jgi:hypothetical protein
METKKGRFKKIGIPFIKLPTDSIFFAYLVPLDEDVVPIKFHQFLFGE